MLAFCQKHLCLLCIIGNFVSRISQTWIPSLPSFPQRSTHSVFYLNYSVRVEILLMFDSWFVLIYNFIITRTHNFKYLTWNLIVYYQTFPVQISVFTSCPCSLMHEIVAWFSCLHGCSAVTQNKGSSCEPFLLNNIPDINKNKHKIHISLGEPATYTTYMFPCMTLVTFVVPQWWTVNRAPHLVSSAYRAHCSINNNPAALLHEFRALLLAAQRHLGYLTFILVLGWRHL